MKNRTHRMALATETLDILKKGFYINKNHQQIEIKEDCANAISGTELIKEETYLIYAAQSTFVQRFNTHFEVNPESILVSARRLSEAGKQVFCLNFASAKNPGGGFLGGAQAQEETLARSSALYNCLLPQMEMYERNRNLKTCLYSDEMIYSPNVPIFRDENGALLTNYYKMSILTAPAVNAGAVRRQEANHISQIEIVMHNRIEKVLQIAAIKGYTTLILGAWGCGVFQNNPLDIARYFKYHLYEGRFQDVFENVVFAIYAHKENDENLIAFKKYFP